MQKVEFLLIGYFLCDDYHATVHEYEGYDIDNMISEKLKKLDDGYNVYTLTFNTKLFNFYAKDPENPETFFAVKKYRGVTNFVAPDDVDNYLTYIEVFFDECKRKFEYIQLPVFGFKFDSDILREFLKHGGVITPKSDVYATFAAENNLSIEEGFAFEKKKLDLELNGRRFLLRNDLLRF